MVPDPKVGRPVSSVPDGSCTQGHCSGDGAITMRFPLITIALKRIAVERRAWDRQTNGRIAALPSVPYHRWVA